MIGVDEPTLSKFENYKCLPTPDMMERILKALNCSITEIYDREEVTFRTHKKTANSSGEQPNTCYKMTVRVPARFKDHLQVALKTLGYSSITQWINQCTEDLLTRCEEAEKQKKTSSTADQGMDEVKNEEIRKASSFPLYHKNDPMSRGEVKKVEAPRL